MPIMHISLWHMVIYLNDIVCIEYILNHVYVKFMVIIFLTL